MRIEAIVCNEDTERLMRFAESAQLLDDELWDRVTAQFGRPSDASDNGWRGEYWGKLMRSACLVYKYTKNESLYERLFRSVNALLKTQDAAGRFSTYPADREFVGWDMWCRKYILVGLEYFLDICRDEMTVARITKAMCRHCDYIIDHIGPSGEGKIPITDTSDIWGGMNSCSILKSFVCMYKRTGNEAYLRFAAYIVSEGGSKGFDIFNAARLGILSPYEYPVNKAYEMISCFEGLLAYGEAVGNEEYIRTCRKFADAVLDTDFTIVGGLGCRCEEFNHSTTVQASLTDELMQETCVSVSMLLYLNELMRFYDDRRYADAAETIYCNLYAGAANTSRQTSNFGMPYDSYSPLIDRRRNLVVGGRKDIAPNVYYGCCAAMGAAGIGVAPSMALSAGEQLTVRLYNFVRAELSVNGCRATLSVQTAYPVEGNIRFVLTADPNVRVPIRFRRPGWNTRYSVNRNGRAETCSECEGYIVLNEPMHGGDTIEIAFDIPVKCLLACAEDGTERFALQRGPVVLAADSRLTPTDRVYTVPVLPDGTVDVVGCNRCDFAPRVYNICLRSGETVPLVEYAYAGKEWDENIRVSVWFTSGTE